MRAVITSTEAASQAVLEPLLAYTGDLRLRQKGYTVHIKEKQLRQEITYEALADAIFPQSMAPRGAELSCRTTMSFRQEGQYVLWPQLPLIWQSLLNRWNAFSPQIKLEEQQLADSLAGFSRITKYQLRSQAYALEGQNLYGFYGSMRLRFFGNDMTNRVLGLLMAFAPFAGIGIKTALGMGAVDTELLYKEE